MLAYISKFRTEIMGQAIIGVMLAHIKCIACFPESLWNKLLGVFCYSVFTGGFLLLSGLGLYKSFSVNDNIGRFYKKRARRLMIPYICLSFPFFVFTDLYLDGGGNIIQFLGHISTISFWLNGNFYGMWYIAVSVALYIVYPWVHNFVYNNNGTPYLRFVCLMGLCAIVKVLCKYFFPDYYAKISIALETYPLMLVGSYIMYIIDTKTKYSFDVIFCSKVIVVAVVLLLATNIDGMLKPLFVLLWSIIFYFLDKKFLFVTTIFKWFGKYTLELYILHMLMYYSFIICFPDTNKGVLITVGVLLSILICKPIHMAFEKLFQ